MQKNSPVLKQCLLFSGIEEQNLEALLGCLGARPQRYGKGEAILREGDPANHLGIVLGGSVQVVREDYYGNRSIMAKLGPTDMFAEAFACADVPAIPVSVIALEATEALLIDAHRITCPCQNACSFHSQLINNMIRILATKNLLCNRKIEVTSKRSTREKLMTYLMLRAKETNSNSFSIPFDRQELADYLEVDRSGLSSEISKLRKEGVLTSEKNQFTLL